MPHKKYSAKQKKLASVASPRNKITGAGFKALKKKPKAKNGKKSKSGYPKCVPASKASRMTASQKKSAVSRKRAVKQGVGGKPTNVRTFARKKKKK